MLSSTFDLSDLRVTGPAGSISTAGFSIQPTDDRSFQVTTSGLSAEGNYQVAFGPQITDLSGNQMASEQSASFTIDLTGPSITQATPAGVVNAFVNFVDVTFNEPINPSSFTQSDIQLLDPAGRVIAAGAPYRLTGNIWRISTGKLAKNGTYSLTIGPLILDVAGNAMNQNAAGAFSSQFEIALPDFVIPTNSVQLTPASPVFGGQMNVQWDTKNQGTATANGPWTDRVWLSRDAIYSADDTLLTTLSIPASATLTAGGSVTRSAGVTLPLSAAFPAGNYFLILMTNSQSQVAEAIGTNNTFVQPITITNPPLPDLIVVNNSIVAPANINAGQTVNVSWQVDNIGTASATGPWRERVYLASTPAGTDRQLLGEVIHSGNLAPADGVLDRSAQFQIPTYGLSGDLYFLVEVDSTSVIVEIDESNQFASATTGRIRQELSLSVATSTLTEGGPVTQATLTRNGNVSQALVVTLSANVAGQLSIPATVTIPAGQYSVRFNIGTVDNTTIESTAVVTVSAAATNYLGSSVFMTVQDDDLPTISLLIPAGDLNEGSSVTVTITRDFVTNVAVAVTLTGETTQLQFPSTVIIPANAATSQFNLTAFDDTRLERTAVYSFTAKATGHITSVVEVTIPENDVPVLTLTLPAAELVEGDNRGSLKGRVTRSVATPQAVQVAISTSLANQLSLPATVTIPANATFVEFPLAVLDDNLVNGDRSIVVTVAPLPTAGGLAFSSGNDSKSLLIRDNDGPTLSVSANQALVSENGTGTIVVRRNTSTTSALVVQLVSSNTAELIVPASVTIPAGASEVTVTVTGVNDNISDGNKPVNITATSSGFNSGIASLVVTDIDLPDLQVSILSTSATGLTDQSIQLNYVIQNTGLVTAVGTWTQRIYLSSDNIVGNDILIAQTTSSGPLAVAGQQQLSQTVNLPHSPGSYWFVVETDAAGSIVEGLESNNTTITVSPIAVAAAYTATVSTDVDMAPADTSVLMTGSATRSDGSAAAYQLVNVHVLVRGTSRVLPVITDANGRFQTTFRPLPGEGGVYTIGATHPGVETPQIQDTFKLLGMRAEPPKDSVQVREAGVAVSRELTIRNLADVPLTGVAVMFENVSSNLVVSGGLPGGATTLGSLNTALLTFSIRSINATITSAAISIRVSSNEAPDIVIPVSVTVIPLVARLQSDQLTLNRNMLVGDQTVVEFTITNTGGKATGELRVLLPTGANWLTLATSVTLPSLNSGATASVTLLLTPSQALELTAYQGSLVVAGSNVDLEIPFTFRAVSQSVGGIAVTVVDEYYYFTDEKPNVAGAAVGLLDAITGAVVATTIGTSNGSGIFASSDGGPTVTVQPDGTVLFGNVPAGPYTLSVRSDKHESYSNTIRIAAGGSETKQVFISRNLVEYIWTVEEIEIEDRTRITVDALFETNVPAPVVVVDGAIDLAEISVVGQTKQFNIKITNYGLIAAENVAFDFGTHPFFEIVPLINEIGILPAMSDVTIPVRVTRIADFDQQSTGFLGTGTEFLTGARNNDLFTNADGNSVPCAIFGCVVWEYVCGYPIYKCTLIPIYNVPGNCPPPSGGGGGGGTVFGGGKLSVTPVSIATPTDDCQVCEEAFDDIDITLMAFIPAPAVVLYDINPDGLYPIPTDGLPLLRGDDRGFDPNAEKYRFRQQITVNVGNSVGTYEDTSTYTESAGTYFSFLNGSTPIGKPWWWVEPNFTDEEWTNKGEPKHFTDKIKVTRLSPESIRVDMHMSVVVPPAVGNPLFSWLPKGEYYILPALDSDLSIVITQPCGKAATYSVSGFHDGFPNFELYINGETVSQFDAVAEEQTPWSLFPPAEIPYTNQGDGVADGTGPSPMSLGQLHSAEVLPMADEVCAQVRIQLSQDAVQVRDAFDARLDISNSGPMSLTDIGVEILVRDEAGKDVTNLFAIYPTFGRGLSGVDGGGVLGPNSSGTANLVIVPTSLAASSTPTAYFIGGSLLYTENGLRVNIPLAQVEVIVYPQAELGLKYFWQRDVISDDPFTAEIEPAEPFTLAVQLQNNGAGAARNLRIESAQPRIVENEKGLLIDFQITGTRVNGGDVNPSLTANFGTVAPGGIAIAEWQMESTLQGLFVDYNASFEHISGLGDERLSLIKSVEIHELIRSINAAQLNGDDGLPDFLVNDLADPNDLPDTLYLSDGSVMDVGLGSDAFVDAAPTLADLQVALTATMGTEWSYLKLDDPSQGLFKLIGIRRSDGNLLPTKNFWQTDRTFIGGGKRPVLEHKLHLVDFNSTGSYTLIFSNGDTVGPHVESFVAVDPNPTAVAIDALTVVFSEAINAGSFDPADVSLLFNGTPVSVPAGMSIQQVDAVTFTITGLAGATATDGVYELRVDSTGVTDIVGNSGLDSQSVTWVKGEAAPAIVQISGVDSPYAQAAIQTVEVTFTESIDISTLTAADLTFTRDGQALDLASIEISQSGDHSYRISGLPAGVDGHYQLTVDASGVNDLTGVAGVGSRMVQWTLDSTAPGVVDVIDVVTNPRNTVVQQIDVQFSEPIDAASFDVSDLILTRDGGSTNLLAGDSRITITHLSGNTYRVRGLNWVQGFVANPQIATFTLSVSATGVLDLAGNAGIGSASTSWTIDLAAPAAPSNLLLSSAAGPSVNGTVGSRNVTLFGDVSEAGLTLSIYDLTTSTELARIENVDPQFSVPFTFPSLGNHTLRIRAIDRAGNTADSSLTVFVDEIAPFVTEFGGVPETPVATGLNSLTVTFSKSIDANSFTAGDLQLFRNGNAVSLDAGTVLVVAETSSRFRIEGLTGFNQLGGDYQLIVDTTGIKDTVGNSGLSTSTAAWTVSAAAIIVSPVSGLTTTDAGGTATFSVRLNRAPTADVRIPVTSDNAAQGVASVTELIFTAANWNVPQTVTVTGHDDSIVNGNAVYRILLQPAVSSDPDYSGFNADDVRVTNIETSRISGVKWRDSNANGVRDANESLLAGWTIFIDSNGNGRLDDGERFTKTDQNGVYQFTGLTAGTYIVSEVIPAGWAQSFPGVNGLTTEVAGLSTTGSAQILVTPGSVSERGDASSGVDLIGLGSFQQDARFGGIDGHGLAVVVIDTGLDLDHSAFGPDLNGDGIADRIVFQYDFGNNDADASDYSGHGTHVTSIIASQSASVQGIAPGVNIIHLKVFSDSGQGIFANVERALQWVVAHAAEYNVVAVNMSLGDNGNWTTDSSRYGIGDELAALEHLNVITVAAAGNSFYGFNSTEGLAYPASDSNVLSVGAVWAGDFGGPWGTNAIDYSSGTDRLTAFSQRDSQLLDIVAPGALITGAFLNGTVQSMRGTSQAAPFVTGSVILIQQLAEQHLGRRLSLSEIRELMHSSGVIILDGDNEDDNVTNTGDAFYRLDLVAMANHLLDGTFHISDSGNDPGTIDQNANGGNQDTAANVLGAFSHTLILDAGANVESIDFGNFQYGLIAGRRWNDLDRDSVQDGNEPFTTGWTVTLTDSSGHVVATTVTGDWDRDGNGLIDPATETGWYRFENLRPGQYFVLEASDPSWKQSMPALGDGQTVFNLDKLLNFRDAGESWNNWGGLNEKWFTGNNGWYFITPAGEIFQWNGSSRNSLTGTVVATVSPRYHSDLSLVTSPSAPSEYRHLVVDGQSVTNLDFGDYQQQSGSIRGRKWHDLNGDGVYDADEPFLNGERINLLDAAGVIVGTVLTSDLDIDGDGSIDPQTESGWYVFENLAPGQFTVLDELSPNSWRTAPNDDLAALVLGLDQAFKFTASQFDWFNWAGLQEKWFFGSGNWYYVVPDGTLYQWVRETRSPVTGLAIANLSERYYQYPEDIYTPRLPQTYRIHLTEGDVAASFDFGVALSTTLLSGQFFDDQNNNGQRDAGEQPQNGALVEVLDFSGQIVANSLTADIDLDGNGLIDPETESGWYTITGLGAGPYEVQFVPLDGWQPDVDSQASVTARTLSAQLQIRSTGNPHTNWAGLGEKWIWSNNRWMFIKPDGTLFSAPSGNVAHATQIATLDNQH